MNRSLSDTQATIDAAPRTRRANLRWWREARFGMFIHWGLYSQLAGYWNGQPVPGIGEWIMYFGKIEAEPYERLARDFNPQHFDADAWVRLAQRAGMKYLVITTKHHDGFAMYDSPSSSYNIVAATPFARDIMSELAASCRKHGVRLCFYYSQTQDWHHPGGAGHWQRDGVKMPADSREFQQYLEERVKPQLRELLTQYGPVGLIWFDTPLGITRKQSLDLKRFVKALQPDCLVCGRIGNGVGDYQCLGDNMIPIATPRGNWETPATLNDTWGFKRDDDNWKTVDHLLYLLVDLASKGVNYLLNIGPTGDGVVPAPSVTALEAIGDWLAVNGESIYESQASPFPYEFPWGRMTRKRGRLYLHLLEWPKEPLQITGLRNKITRARLLADPSMPIKCQQTHHVDRDEHLLSITLPATPPKGPVPVICLNLAGRLDVDPTLRLLTDGQVKLPVMLGDVSPRDSVQFARNGSTQQWTTVEPCVTWRFKIDKPGRYRVEVATGCAPRQPWTPGHELVVRIDDQVLQGALRHDRDEQSPRAQYQPEVISDLGSVDLPSAGEYVATLQARHLADDAAGLMLASVRLVLE